MLFLRTFLLLLTFAPARIAPAADESSAAGPVHLTVKEAVERARTVSYPIVAIEKRIADAQSYLDRSSAWLASNPFVSGGASATSDRFTDSAQGEVPSGKEGFGPSYTFTLQQDFEIAGQRNKRMDSARRGIDVVLHERDSVEANLRAEVQKAFSAALERDAKLQLAQRSTVLFEQVNAAFNPQPQTEPQRIALNSSIMQIHRQRRREASAKRERDDAYRELKRLIGVAPEVAVVLQGELEPRPRQLPSYVELLDGLADRRADVAAYRSLLERAEAELALAKRLAIPDLSVFGFVSRFDSGGSEETSGGGSLGFALPVFQGNGPSIADAISERHRAAAELDDLIVLVENNLASAYALAADTGAELDTVLTQIMPRARENVELAARRVERGEIRAVDSVDYELELLGAEQELVTAQRVYTDALVELEKAAARPLREVSIELEGPAAKTVENRQAEK